MGNHGTLPVPMSPLSFLACALLLAYTAWRAYQFLQQWLRESRLHPIVPYTRRHAAIPAHGQRVQLSPAEAAMARAALEFHGAMRITVVALLRGPDIEPAPLRDALARLCGSHPLLRSRILEVRCGLVPVLVAEVDDGLVIPVTHTHVEGVSLEAAWRTVWEKHEKVCAVHPCPRACAGFPCGHA